MLILMLNFFQILSNLFVHNIIAQAVMYRTCSGYRCHETGGHFPSMRLTWRTDALFQWSHSNITANASAHYRPGQRFYFVPSSSPGSLPRSSVLNTGMCNNAQHMLLEAYLASFFEKEYPLQHEEACHQLPHIICSITRFLSK